MVTAPRRIPEGETPVTRGNHGSGDPCHDGITGRETCATVGKPRCARGPLAEGRPLDPAD